ncbi:winged helix-turn-helix domain-containing protein [Enterobacter roggenkampii]|uniref:winged helix-turn-helix domain-containing protein n=1 Tax=Enterobacter roggenkampii TaxID=1812935 RepID=UPI002FF48E27
MLHNIASPESRLTINATSARCLKHLLEKHGVVVSREELLDIGWGASGMIVAPSSLNQAISQLRRNFRDLGEPSEVITTVSREGYRITTAVDVKHISADAVIAYCDDSSAEIVRQLPLKRPVWQQCYTTLKLLMTCLFSCLITSVVIYIFVPQSHSLSFNVFEQTAFPNSHVYFQSSINDKARPAKAVDILKKNSNLSLLAKKYPYIYINNTYSDNVFSFFFCSESIYKSPSECQSYNIVFRGEK